MRTQHWGILSAVLASACCLIPLTLVLLGLGSLGLGSFVGRYHWLFQGLAVAVLSGAWWYFLKERKRLRGLASDMKTEAATQWTLALASLVVAFFLGLNFLTALRGTFAEAESRGVGSQGVTMTFPVEGMDCVTCELPIEAKLRNLPGIFTADASAPRHSVTVAYDPEKVSLGQIVDTVNSTGYRAKIPE